MKSILLLEYLLYVLLISRIPFSPGTLIRRIYFNIFMGGKLGKNVEIGERVKVGKYRLLVIEDNVSIRGNVILGYAIGGKIKLQKGALVGHDVVFVNNMHQYRDRALRIQDQGYITPHQDIMVGKNVWIGTRAIIMPGVKIGDYSIIGAGAVVTKDIPKNSIAVGVPAVIKKKR